MEREVQSAIVRHATHGVVQAKSLRALEKITCAWCGRVKKGNGAWEEKPAKKLPRSVTHGICPECLTSEMCAES